MPHPSAAVEGGMKAPQAIIDLLNQLLVGELTAINQYFLGAKVCRQRGLSRLAHHLRKESLDEMKHAEALVERILFLGGLPNLQKLDKIQIAETVPDQMRADLDLERRSVAQLNDGVKRARDAGDNGTATLLEGLLEAAEAHVDWLEAQVALIESLGAAQYLAQQVHEG
jgi:bacterioferritin